MRTTYDRGPESDPLVPCGRMQTDEAGHQRGVEVVATLGSGVHVAAKDLQERKTVVSCLGAGG